MYKCAFGHTSYHPSCDACDSATSSDDPYFPEEASLKHKAAIQGKTLREYLEDDEEDL